MVPNETHATFRRFLSTHFPRPTAKGYGSGVAAPVSAITFTVNGKPSARQVCISYSRQLGSNTTPDAVLHFTVDQADSPYDCLVGLFDIPTKSANERSTGAPLFDKVRELSLDCHTFYRNKYADWAEALYHFPSLEILQFPEDMLYTIIMALRWRVTPGLVVSLDVHEDRGTLVDGEDELQAGLNVQTIHVLPSQKHGFATARNTLELFASYLVCRPLKEVRLPSGLMTGMVTKFSTEKLKTLIGQMT
ncbi:hypothetical protein PENSPDRAFT_686717 [Peniophora sp. CONT]|nr:hypothetical protein PENSPDRAFT_686717 [Peniophora sp. CONT]